MMSILILLFASLMVTALAQTDMEENIFGGEDAAEGFFPYQVGIARKNKYVCGGALISPTFILSAAHCFKKRDSAKVYSAYLGSIKVMEGIQRVGRSLIMHSKYNSRNNANDIALLEIDEVPYSDDIWHVDLPDISNNDIDYEEARAIASGWGYVNAKKERNSMLQYTELTVVSNDVCAKVKRIGEFVRETNICAGDYDRGTTPCKGDSGGPLVEMNSLVLIGLTSFGPSASKCAEQISTVFTSVPKYRQWILDNSGV